MTDDYDDDDDDGGTHENVYLRAILDGLQCSDEFIAPSGYLDQQFLIGKWPGIEEALTKGLEWSVISYEVIKARKRRRRRGRRRRGRRRRSTIVYRLSFIDDDDDVTEAFPQIIEIGYKALNRTDTSEVSELEGIMTMHSIFERIVKDMSCEVLAQQQKAAWDTAVQEATLTNPFWLSWAQALRKFASVVPKEIIEEARDMKVATFKAEGVA